MELAPTTHQLVNANLGKLYIQRLKQRLAIVQSLLSLGLASFGLFFLPQKDNFLLSLIIFLAFGIGTGLVTSLIRWLVMKRLTIIIDSLFPLSQARHSTQSVSLNQIETAITQQIFNLKASPITATNTASLDLETIDAAQFGLMSLDSQLQLNYANRFARQLLDIQSNLKLDFGDQPNLTDWIHRVQAHQVSAHKSWLGLSYFDATTNQYQWFDLVADFHKSTAHETLILITPTTEPAQAQQGFDFVTYAAHELRGPVTIIRGYLDILQSDFPNKSSTEQVIVDRLIVAGNRLSGYISNILNVAKFDQKSLNLNPQPTAPAAIIDEIYDDIQLRAKTNQQQLSINIEPDLPLVPIDRASFNQALTNLVDNAIKYSDPNSIIFIKLFKNDSEVSFQVKDQGAGIPPNVVSNLFKRFYRSYRAQNQAGGTGIGLFITQVIVKAHRGRITVSSELGVGSTFTISLPVNPNQASNPEHLIHNHGLIRK